MRIARSVAATLAALGLLFAGAVIAAPAAAAADQTVTNQFSNHADSGHGTPDHWADDTYSMTSTIHDNGGGTYTVTLSSTGTFTTVVDGGYPNGSTGTIDHKVTGNFKGTLTAQVTGTPKTADQLSRINGNAYDDADGVHYTTSEWIKHLFQSASNPSIGTETYNYAYDRGSDCEKWVDADTNNDGQDASAGNVTGKDCASVLTVKNLCRASKTDKHNTWTVTNNNVLRAPRQFWMYLYSPTANNGHVQYMGTKTVAAGKTVQEKMPHGGKFAVTYYDGYGHAEATPYVTSSAKDTNCNS